MKKILIPFIACLIVSFSGFSQSTSTVYTCTDSISSLRNKTALAVVYTMYYQDSIIVIQSEENKLWQARYESQKQYSDSCDAMTKSCVLVAKNYKSENDMLHKQLKCKTILLRVFQTTTAASLLTLFILL